MPEDVMTEDTRGIICYKCNKEPVLKRVDFTYLGHLFHADSYRCPQCGIVFISRELAEGKIAEVEKSLEDK